ncbi:hypothetical protein [Cellulomonas sp. NPDC058312]|jgi:hypothetical protein|uniref:hypothetical protein n=1 Tax=Cellulomonas sp. NPDC058312 TaxID=3346441 RepID=UPI0036EA4CA6
MDASTPQDPGTRTGSAIPSAPGHPASPGPDPDDINQSEHDTPREDDHAADTPTASPTSPGPTPADVDDRP